MKPWKSYLGILGVVLLLLVAAYEPITVTTPATVTPITLQGSLFDQLATLTPLPVVLTPTSGAVQFSLDAMSSEVLASMDVVQLQRKSDIYVSDGGGGGTYDLSTVTPPEVIGEVTTSYKTYGGVSYPVYWVNDWYCQNITPGTVIRAFVQAFRQRGVPLEYGMPLIASESSFEEYVYEGGKCRLKQNNAGAPAYCAGQIYGPAHPSVDYIRLATDLNYCVDLSISVFKGMYSGTGDWVEAAAYYKGFAQLGGKNNASFINNYMPFYNRGNHTYNGMLVPYNDSIDSTLSQYP